MISLRPNTTGRRLLEALVANPGSTPDELARNVVTFPALTWEEATGPRRYAILKERQAARSKAAGMVRRLQEAGVVETRSRARLSAEWVDLIGRHPAFIALRIMSAGQVRERDVQPFLDTLALVAMSPVPRRLNHGQDEVRLRQLVAWGVVVAPSARWATAKGRALVEGAREV